MTNAKALIVSYYFPPMNGPVTQHAGWFARFLAEHDLETHVISSSVFYGENVNAPLVKGNVHSLPSGRIAQGAAWRLSQAELLVQRRMGLWEHGFAWARAYGIREGCRLIRAGGVKVVISVSPSIASHWAAYKIKQRFPSVKWIADFTDPFLGNPFRGSKPWVKPFEKRLEQAIFSTADYLAANTKPGRDLWRERYPEFACKFLVIPNGYDPEEPIAAQPLPARDTPILAHAGAVYGGRVPVALLHALFELTQAGRITPGQIAVEFLGLTGFGDAVPRERLDFLFKTGLVRLRNEYVPREEALRFTETADMLLLLDITAPHNTKLQVPSKLFDYLRVGRPILAFTAAESPVAKILAQAGIRHVTIPNESSPAEVEAGVLDFLALPREPQPLSEWLTRYFDARNIVGGLANLIEGGRMEEIPSW